MRKRLSEFFYDLLFIWFDAENPKTPKFILKWKVKSPHSFDRYFAAKNPNTPSEALAKLSRENDLFIQYNVALNPSTTADVFEYFINSFKTSSFIITCCVFVNPSLPDYLKEYLIVKKYLNYYVA